ncbi:MULTISPECIES: molybdopterin-dependent oxidoreductase [unclassified Brevibacterium]|uniref:molybdopterin-dependent oxidoreductase n=1 Tax=unclassified Brevibacterium TaxID=2614124 RepID=UPI0024B61C72|nr:MULTISPECIES: molybdopterin-dependent oxidoreductase [unclassified Brevibacterium]
MRLRLRPILVGVAATLLLFGLADLVARLIGPTSAPLLVLGQAIIPLTPTSVIKPVIALFGANDKIVLVATVALGALILGALIGWLGGSRPRVGLAAFIVAGLVPAGAVLTRTGSTLIDLVPTLVGLVAGVAVLWVGLRWAAQAAAARAAVQVPATRPGRWPLAPSGGASATGRDGASATDPDGASATGRDGASATGPDGASVTGPDGAAAGATPADDPSDRADAEAVRPVARTPLLTRDSPAERTQRAGSRRRFLALTGIAAAIGAVGVATGQSLVALTREAAASAANLVLPRPARTAGPIPAGASLDVAGIRPFVTAQKDFYRIDTVLAPPTIDPQDWSLTIRGMVDQEVTITMDELLALPLQEQHTTLTCVSNPVGGDLVGNATWLGYPIRELLRRAGPSPDADMVLSHSHDGFTASTPLEAMLDDRDALLAVGMNGEPLTPVHGFPARLVVAGLYGFVSATKWVTELEVTRFDEKEAYWTQRGWDAKAPILVASRIDVPRPLAKLPAGTITVGGSAWAQTRGIDRVEVRLDNGDWTEAELGAEATVDTWRQWRAEFDDVRSGLHSVTVRAVDKDGTVQTAERREAIPNSATGHHRIQFTVE